MDAMRIDPSWKGAREVWHDEGPLGRPSKAIHHDIIVRIDPVPHRGNEPFLSGESLTRHP
jgi:hypothetical protein